jgi:hypothetical protein
MTPKLPVTPAIVPATLNVHLSKTMSIFVKGTEFDSSM